MRAEDRAKQLTAIDPDWNCPWPLDWQRHYRVLSDLVDADGTLPDIHPGVLFEGDDLGRWLERQRQATNWAQLATEQQERLVRRRPCPVGGVPRGVSEPVPAYRSPPPVAVAVYRRAGGVRRFLGACSRPVGPGGIGGTPRSAGRPGWIGTCHEANAVESMT
jgi:hypothetical protein